MIGIYLWVFLTYSFFFQYYTVYGNLEAYKFTIECSEICSCAVGLTKNFLLKIINFIRIALTHEPTFHLYRSKCLFKFIYILKTTRFS